jgi:hypothetical protein
MPSDEKGDSQSLSPSVISSLSGGSELAEGLQMKLALRQAQGGVIF